MTIPARPDPGGREPGRLDVLLAAPYGRARSMENLLAVEDGADVATPLQDRLFHPAQVIDLGILSQRALQILLADVPSPHGVPLNLPVDHESTRIPLDQVTEPAEVICERGKRIVHPDQNERCHDRGDETAGRGDGAAQNRAEHDAHDHIEGREFADEPLFTHSDQRQPANVDDHRSKSHLPHGQFLLLQPEQIAHRQPVGFHWILEVYAIASPRHESL